MHDGMRACIVIMQAQWLHGAASVSVASLFGIDCFR